MQNVVIGKDVGAKFKCSITLLLRKMLAVTVGCQEADLLGRLQPGGRWTYEPRDASPFCYINDDGKRYSIMLVDDLHCSNKRGNSELLWLQNWSYYFWH